MSHAVFRVTVPRASVLLSAAVTRRGPAECEDESTRTAAEATTMARQGDVHEYAHCIFSHRYESYCEVTTINGVCLAMIERGQERNSSLRVIAL